MSASHRRHKPLLPRRDVTALVQARRQQAMQGVPPLRRPNFAPFEAALASLTHNRLAELGQALRGATIPDIQGLMERGELTVSELTLYFLARIRRYDGRLRSVAELNPEALTVAAELDAERRAGHVRGLLHGIPLLLKDNIGTGDRMHTTAGAAVLLEAGCDRDAFVVARLRAAGAVILGKTNMSEWANYMSDRSSNGFSAVGGQVRNPLGRFDVGGSSSGSGAAVAAGLAVAAVGTETYGSIISPAGRCGVIGHKPTHGLVSRDRIIPITDATDTAGPIARNSLDAAILLHALAGADANDPATRALSVRPPLDGSPELGSEGLRGKRVGWMRWGGRRFGAASAHGAVRAALGESGAEVVDIAFDPPGVNFGPIFDYGFKHGVAAYLAATEAPVRSVDEVIAFNRRDMRRYAPRGQAILERAARSSMSRAEYDELVATGRERSLAAVRAEHAEHRLDFLLSFNTFDALNMGGSPILSLPAGPLPNGEPVAVLLVAEVGWDAELLAAGRALELALASAGA